MPKFMNMMSKYETVVKKGKDQFELIDLFSDYMQIKNKDFKYNQSYLKKFKEEFASDMIKIYELFENVKKSKWIEWKLNENYIIIINHSIVIERNQNEITYKFKKNFKINKLLNNKPNILLVKDQVSILRKESLDELYKEYKYYMEEWGVVIDEE